MTYAPRIDRKSPVVQARAIRRYPLMWLPRKAFVALIALLIGLIAPSALAQPTQAAAADQPPQEAGTFRASDLVELIKLDPTIKLDIRYATANNFLGRPVYTEARAFLQRPAAEAMRRVNRALCKQGYGLVIHDGYRPWAITKIFWDATPEDKKIFVA